MKAEELAALGQHKMAKVFDVILLLALIGFFTVIPPCQSYALYG